MNGNCVCKPVRRVVLHPKKRLIFTKAFHVTHVDFSERNVRHCRIELWGYNGRLWSKNKLWYLPIFSNMRARQVCLLAGESISIGSKSACLKFYLLSQRNCPSPVLPLQKITCASAGISCGNITNDCGASVSCGACASNEACIQGQCSCKELRRGSD